MARDPLGRGPHPAERAGRRLRRGGSTCRDGRGRDARRRRIAQARRGDAPPCRRQRDLSARDRGGRPRPRHHARDSRLGSPAERGAAAPDRPGDRRRSCRRSSITDCSSARTARSSPSGTGTRPSPTSVTRGSRLRPCAPTWRSSAFLRTTCSWTARASAGSRSRRSPRCPTRSSPHPPALRSRPRGRCAGPARSSRRARSPGSSSSRVRPQCRGTRLRRSSASWSSAQASPPRSTSRERARSCASSRRWAETSASLRLALTGEPRGPELWTVVGRAAGRRGAGAGAASADVLLRGRGLGRGQAPGKPKPAARR